MDIVAWMKLAIDRMCLKDPNSAAFELKDLFTGDEWNTLSRGEKTTFGKVFAAEVRAGNIDGIRLAPIGEHSRHNRYIVY